MRYLLKLHNSDGQALYRSKPYNPYLLSHWQPWLSKAQLYTLPEACAITSDRIPHLTEGQQLIIIAVKEGSSHGKE